MTTAERIGIALGSIAVIASYDALCAWACWRVPAPWFWPCLATLMCLHRLTGAVSRVGVKK